MYEAVIKSEVIRPWPYPFKGALSISNDPDFLDFAFFDVFMEFLNTNHNTKLGEGIGLECTSSLFFFTKNPYNFSYFMDDSIKKSKFARRIDDYLREHWIDANHAFGDYDFHGGFDRWHAEAVYGLLDNLGVRLPIFTNHGDANNFQNVGIGYPDYRGDIKGSDYFHADLMEENGVKYIWKQDLVDERLPFSGSCFENNPLKYQSSIKGFRRYRGTGVHAPNLSSLNFQIGCIDFEELYRRHSFVILNQHVGVAYRYARRCEAASIEIIQNRQAVYLSGLYVLHDHYHSGKLWISGLARLLDYLFMIGNTTVTELSHNTFEIETSQDSGVDLAGLTIYADTKDQVDILYKGKRLPFEYNGPDETGHYSVSIPISSPKNIW